MAEYIRYADLIIVLLRYGIRAPHEVPSFLRGAPKMLEDVAESIERGTPPIWLDQFVEAALAEGLLESRDRAEAIKPLRLAAERLRAAQLH